MSAPLRMGRAVADFGEGRIRAADGTVTQVRSQSAEVLRALAARPDETVSKAALMDAVWPGIAVTEDSLAHCIRDIRRALGPDQERLATLPKRGSARRLEADPAAGTDSAAQRRARRSPPRRSRPPSSTRRSSTRSGSGSTRPSLRLRRTPRRWWR